VVPDPSDPNKCYFISQSTSLTRIPSGLAFSATIIDNVLEYYLSPSVTSLGNFNNGESRLLPGLLCSRVVFRISSIAWAGFGGGCKNLVSLTIPASLTRVDNGSFNISRPNAITTLNFARPNGFTAPGVDDIYTNWQSLAVISNARITVNVYNCLGNNDSTVTTNFRGILGNVNIAAGGKTINYLSAKAPPTIGYFPNINISDGRTSYTLVQPYSDSDGTFSYSVISGNSVASVSSSTLTILSAGTAIIQAKQSESTYYAEGTINATLTVQYPSPTITLTIPTKVYNQTFNVDASSNSTGNLTYTSGNISVATVSGNTVTTRGVGNAIILVEQAASSSFTTGNLTVNFTVLKANQVISNFPSTVSGFYGNNYQYSPASNGNGVISYQSGNPSIATVDASGVVRPMAIGNTTIRLIQASNAFYNDISASSTFTVNKGNPVISLSNISKTFGNPSFKINATSASIGNFTYNSGNLFVANITIGNTVNIIGAGSTTISVSQDATTFYNSATGNATIIVDKAVPTITFSNISKTYGNPIFRIDPSSNPVSDSDGAFTLSSSDTNVLQITDFSANIVGAGTSIITASQAESNNYLAGDISATLTVAKALPTITFTNISKTYNDPIFRIDPSSNPVSNSNGAFTFSSSNTNVVQITDFSANIVGAGNAIITASQAATSDYLARDISAILIVAKALHTITGFTVPDKVFRDVSFALIPPSSTPSTGAFTYSSGNTAIASITNGNYVVINNAGNTTITATQDTDANYLQNSITATFYVAKASPNLQNFPPITKTYNDISFVITDPETLSSGNFTYTSGNTSVVNLYGNTVSIDGAGTTTITATQDETANYLSQDISTTIEVAKDIPNITGFTLADKTFNDDPFTLSINSNSLGAFTFSTLDTNVINIIDSSVTIVGIGNATITASQAETNNYFARDVSDTFFVEPGDSLITGFSLPNKVYGDISFGLPIPNSESGGEFTYITSNEAVAKLYGNIVSIESAGNAIITAIQAAYENYAEGSISSNFYVAKAQPEITNFAVPNKVYEDLSFAIPPPDTPSTGAFTYTSGNITVASITEGNKLVINNAGNTVITATQATDANYLQGNITATFYVAKASPYLDNFPPITKTYNDLSFVITDPETFSSGNFTYTSGNTSVVNLYGNTVSIDGAGTTTITATQEETSNY
jgi:hypothetical protein